MISRSVEYALRAIILLARNAPRSLSTRTIAREGEMPAPYLCKMLHKLVVAKLIVPRFGQKGGYSLARTANLISLWDVYSAFEPASTWSGCHCADAALDRFCPLHKCLDVATSLMEEHLRNTSIAQILMDVPYCAFHESPQKNFRHNPD